MKQLKTQIICASAAVLLFGFTGQSTASAVKSESVRNGSTETEQEWTFAAFGQNVVTDENHIGYSVSEDGSVTVWNLNKKGKLVLKVYKCKHNGKSRKLVKAFTLKLKAKGDYGYGRLTSKKVQYHYIKDYKSRTITKIYRK